MKKILLFTFLLSINFSTTIFAKEWKGKGERIEFSSMPTMTIKDFLEGNIPNREITIWGTLNTLAYNKKSSDEAKKLVSEFFNSKLKK